MYGSRDSGISGVGLGLKVGTCRGVYRGFKGDLLKDYLITHVILLRVWQACCFNW